MINEILQAILAGLPWALALIIPIIAIAALVVGRNSANWWVAAYFTLLFYFPNASWGILETKAGQNFYTRGAGMFYISAINIMLYGATLQALFSRSMRLHVPVTHNLGIPALMFGILLAGNLLVGLVTPEIRWFEIIGYSGLLNIANLMAAFYVLTSALRKKDDLDRFINLLLFCAVTRGVWGAVRFALLGGDPANFYANFQRIDVNLTFFDINDSLVATLALFVAGWRLTSGQCSTFIQTAAHWFIVLLELFVIIFSYRRTAWGGLLLAGLLFAAYQQRSIKWKLLLSYIVAGIPLILYKMMQRSGESTRGASFLEKIVPDITAGGTLNFTTGRFSELYAAWLSFKESPIWGLGAWGRYDGFRFPELAWHNGDFTWMHSGLLHVALKTGLIGVVAVFSCGWLYKDYVARSSTGLNTRNLGLLLLGPAGILFILPTLLLGTPVIEFRTMQLLSLCLALPYLAIACTGQISPTKQRPRWQESHA